MILNCFKGCVCYRGITADAADLHMCDLRAVRKESEECAITELTGIWELDLLQLWAILGEFDDCGVSEAISTYKICISNRTGTQS